MHSHYEEHHTWFVMGINAGFSKLDNPLQQASMLSQTGASSAQYVNTCT
jgi:hypothetical protein